MALCWRTAMITFPSVNEPPIEVQQFLAIGSLLLSRQRDVKVPGSRSVRVIAIRPALCNGEIASSEIFVNAALFFLHNLCSYASASFDR
jgi:hypothetical protein